MKIIQQRRFKVRFPLAVAFVLASTCASLGEASSASFDRTGYWREYPATELTTGEAMPTPVPIARMRYGSIRGSGRHSSGRPACDASRILTRTNFGTSMRVDVSQVSQCTSLARFGPPDGLA